MKINNVAFYNSLINFGAKNKKTKKRQNSTARNNQPQLVSAQVSQRNLTPEEKAILFAGEIDCNEIYMDLFDGWISKKNLAKNCTLLALKTYQN